MTSRWRSSFGGAACVLGLALAIALRHLDLPPLKRYAWEDEKDEDEDQDEEK